MFYLISFWMDTKCVFVKHVAGQIDFRLWSRRKKFHYSTVAIPPRRIWLGIKNTLHMLQTYIIHLLSGSFRRNNLIMDGHDSDAINMIWLGEAVRQFFSLVDKGEMQDRGTGGSERVTRAEVTHNHFSLSRLDHFAKSYDLFIYKLLRVWKFSILYLGCIFLV